MKQVVILLLVGCAIGRFATWCFPQPEQQSKGSVEELSLFTDPHATWTVDGIAIGMPARKLACTQLFSPSARAVEVHRGSTIIVFDHNGSVTEVRGTQLERDGQPILRINDQCQVASPRFTENSSKFSNGSENEFLYRGSVPVHVFERSGKVDTIAIGGNYSELQASLLDPAIDASSP